jgi:ubiquinone/menaquinone biosynthesis C-methylase UbiE
MDRMAEPELMDLDDEVDAYVQGDFSTVNQAFADRLMELCGRQERARAVDLGTGPADIPIRVWHARPNWKIVAVDASAPMLDRARAAIDQANAGDAIELALADAKDTGLPAKSFDIIFSNSILHHVSSPAAFWSEVRRLAKTGAVVFLRDLARPHNDAQARELVKQHAGTESALLQEEFYRSLLSAYTVDEVKAQLAAAGLGALTTRMSSDRHLDVFGEVG